MVDESWCNSVCYSRQTYMWPRIIFWKTFPLSWRELHSHNNWTLMRRRSSFNYLIQWTLRDPEEYFPHYKLCQMMFLRTTFWHPGFEQKKSMFWVQYTQKLTPDWMQWCVRVVEWHVVCQWLSIRPLLVHEIRSPFWCCAVCWMIVRNVLLPVWFSVACGCLWCFGSLTPW